MSAATGTGAAPGIDPRGPRFGAAITAVLLLVVVALGLSGASLAAGGLLTVLVAIFAWGAFAGIRRHPWGAVYKALVAPRLAPPTDREDPAAPTFAQLVGFVITAAGLVLHLLGVPGALVVAAGMAFVAAFLNAVFDYCLGCQLYVLLVRAGLIRPRRAAAA
ncbi:DUF4395 domain-containing protein [Microcella daejeonensis]|uniref:DUF4395 domain-containing protein n=1 Tax=Microcella daejeonensis TaxID=2994971 RepID=A0A9E8ML58_9MICO|nr:DUF4395 domain-containing protein [Microcella daejeonensis]WAB81536.1 DUF4395 domain-containing protein [Microcella daejeonensis]